MAVLVVVVSALFLAFLRWLIKWLEPKRLPMWWLFLLIALMVGTAYWHSLPVPASAQGWTGPLWVLSNSRLSGIWHAPLAVGLCVLCAWLSWRAWATFITSGRRISFAWLPAPTFEPKEQDLANFMRKLSGVVKRYRGWLDKDASQVRIGQRGVGRGQMRMTLEVPDQLRSALRQAVSTYHDTELQADFDALPEILPEPYVPKPPPKTNLPALTDGGSGRA